ncbi:MAG TPA: hypothetical protein VFR31_19390 [Thermoanaerobaculia bacterium]|nr:hypothetical protein [Thermoanaerobaculia bacterium]
MIRSFFPKAALLLVLILLLAAPVAQAAERDARTSMPGLFAQIWDFLRQVWAENGLGLDPDGSPRAWLNNGCRIDPDGCVPEQNEADNGCRIDPSGCAN